MAMTQSALLFLGALATGTTLASGWMAMNAGRVDKWTRVVVMFGAALLWGGFGLSSYDVIVRDSAWASASEPIMPLVILGITMAMVMFVYALYDLLHGIAAETGVTDVDQMAR